MKLSTFICFSLFLLGVCFGLIQLWFDVWNHETFFKMIVTDIAFFAISFVAAFLIKEHKESQKISDGSKLD